MSARKLATAGLRLLHAVALAATLATCIGAGQGATQIDPPPPMLNRHHSVGEPFYRSPDGLFVAWASFADGDRSFSIRTFYSGGPKTTSITQTHSLRYWPACIRKASNGTIWIAGKSVGSGNTIIEIWQLGAPSLNSVPTPGISPVVPGAVIDVRDIYDESTAGRMLVENMTTRLGGSTQGMLVKFYDSKDVYALTPHGSVVLVASPVVKPGALQLPLLARAGTTFSGQLVSGGYVYSFRRFDRVPTSEPSIGVLRDTDMDGTLDETLTLSAADYDALGWSDPQAWVP